MSDGIDADPNKVANDLLETLAIPDEGTATYDIKVVEKISPLADDDPTIAIGGSPPYHLIDEVFEKLEDRVDMRKRGKVGELIVDFDDETWELEIEGDSK